MHVPTCATASTWPVASCVCGLRWTFNEIAARLKHKIFHKNDVIIVQGEPGAHCYLVTESAASSDGCIAGGPRNLPDVTGIRCSMSDTLSKRRRKSYTRSGRGNPGFLHSAGLVGTRGGLHGEHPAAGRQPARRAHLRDWRDLRGDGPGRARAPPRLRALRELFIHEMGERN